MHYNTTYYASKTYIVFPPCSHKWTSGRKKGWGRKPALRLRPLDAPQRLNLRLLLLCHGET